MAYPQSRRYGTSWVNRETEKREEAEAGTGGRSPDPPVNGEEGLTRLAELTRAVIAVPKSEVVDPPKKKRRKH